MQTLSILLSSIGGRWREGGRGDKALVDRVEQEVQRTPGALRFDARGYATLSAAGQSWDAGRFETPTLAVLRERVAARGRPGARATFSVLHGGRALSDVGLLQGFADEGTLFQVASQFDCLEARDPDVVPLFEYFTDPTQGPRASMSAFPGTFVRHYAAPRADGSRFVQSRGEQLNLLEHFCRPGVARMNCGYLQTENVTAPAEFARLLEDDFEELRVGVHDGIEVVFGADWVGPIRSPASRIAQVFTSTWAGGGYSEGTLGPHHERVLRQLQRGAYLGTFLAAAALGQRRVITTLIGGGVFDNPEPLIWDAIFWSFDELQKVLPSPLEVVINARGGLPASRDRELRERVRLTGGELIDADRVG